MEKKLYKLRIDPEFHNLIPPLSAEELKMLEESIVRDGCDTPLVVWKGTIVDGHNRYEICHKHNIPFALEEKEFTDNDAAMFWMLEHQLARRNLNSYQRGELVLKFEPMVRKIAASKQANSTGGDNPQLCKISDKAAIRTTGELGKMAGVSHDTIVKVRKLNASADEATKKKLRDGDISINRAYNQMVNSEHEGETRICEHCGEEKPYSDFRIPPNRTSYQPVCKECEAKEKQEEKELKAREADPSITGIDVIDGQVGHVLVGLPNAPEAFDQLTDMLQNTFDYYITSFQGLINQYQSNMITDGNTRKLQSMINKTNKAVINLLNERLQEVI